MSKARLSAIAAASAAAGAGVALWYTHKPAKPPHPEHPPLEIIPPSPPDTIPVIGTRSLPVQRPGPAISAKALGLSPVDPKGILKYGSPGPVADELSSLPLYGAYDRRTRNPSWVAEHITPESISQASADRKNVFRADKSIPVAFRADPRDYSNSGYDRGHQVPAEDAKWSQDAIDETFQMSNMCPQVGVWFNRHYWAYFEDFCRRLTQRYPSVRVVTGPLYLPEKDEDGKWRVKYEVIGNPPNVAVPTHFYKVIYGEEEDTDDTTGKVAVAAFVLPNTRIPTEKRLAEFEYNIADLERARGLEFVKNLDHSRRRRLCEEVECDHRVKDFKKAVEIVEEE
ncbi:hypothetical protein ASPWEDRAFT_699223 [Aspergillus wentii DTO 134E9]|uniref:Endonuclease n=1 Tax=Aspergillus wentii DTO 134E9 TaxID=1073089 RepID=A0A1L9R9S2_ASPWE|nr:uncharacterized protein ASPWEDRAFT_699223 [Aspergillus wentii DTO 134E9]OJJ31671.1 hypothetical protein ASPWEDRAFT_699223 [Aspergillus wentii DTO 134E9]